MNLSEIARRAGKLAADNSPAILTAIAVTGTATTAYLTGRATFKAAEILKDWEWVPPNEDQQRPIELKEKIGLVWKLYIPPAGTLLLTVCCIVGATRISERRAAALASAYSLAQKGFMEYRAKVVEKIGAPKEEAIRAEVAEERLTRAVANDQQLLIVADGEVLCLDELSGRPFKSTAENIKAAVNRTNSQINRDGYASLNDFYAHIGLPDNEFGEEVGWRDDLMDVGFSWTGIDGKPCMSIYFPTKPVRKYYKFA